jgi:hypothetical protein
MRPDRINNAGRKKEEEEERRSKGRVVCLFASKKNERNDKMLNE